MKTILNLSTVMLLLIGSASRCFGMYSIEDVSPERAKELGVTIRISPNGEAGIRVLLEFKAEGELKKITYVQVQIGEGENRIMSAPLAVTYPTPERGSVNFSAYPNYVPRSTVMIVVYNGPKGDVGYNFKVKDFVEWEKH